MARASNRAAAARHEATTTRKRTPPPKVDVAALDDFFTTLAQPYPDPVIGIAEGEAARERLIEKARADPPHPITELFAEPEPRREQTTPRWRGCVVCGAKDVGRAHPGHDVCAGCVGVPAAAYARLDVQRAALTRQQHEAAHRAAAAWEALSTAERDRWGAWYLLREDTSRDADAQRRYEATKAAYALPYHEDAAAALAAGTPPAAVASRYGRDALLGARVPPSLRTYAYEEECLFWANEALRSGAAALDVKAAQLAVCLEDMEPTP